MSSSSGSVLSTNASLSVNGDVLFTGELKHLPPASDVPVGPIPINPPPPSTGPPPPDTPAAPVMPFPDRIDALGGFVGPYFQAAHTLISNGISNADAAPILGPFWTPGVCTYMIQSRRSNAAGTPGVNGAQCIAGRLTFSWGDGGNAVTSTPIGPSTDGGIHIPQGATFSDGITPITDANPLPVGTPMMRMTLQQDYNAGSNAFQFRTFNVSDIHAATSFQPIPFYASINNSGGDTSGGVDVSWIFTPSAGYNGQSWPLSPVPCSYTKQVGSAAVANVPQPWVSGGIPNGAVGGGTGYSPGYVVISNDNSSPPKPSYWVATAFVSAPFTAVPGSQAALFPAVQWQLFGA